MIDELWPWLVVLTGAVVTYLPRALGVALSGRIDAESPLFDWIACVAYAILAALVARMIVLPSGPLAETALATRLAGVAIGVAAFYLARRALLIGCLAGMGALVLLDWLALF
jgi:branched-subunit amino acid transport protein